jgi:hypothetical protein
MSSALFEELFMTLGSNRRRVLAVVVGLATLGFHCVSAAASGVDNSAVAIAALQVKVAKAQPRDKCFLYAELVSRMTEMAAQQFESGDSGSVSETLKQVQLYMEKIHAGVQINSRNLLDAEVLLRRTSLRLTDILHRASEEDRPELEATLKQLNQTHAQLIAQVFKQ